MKQFVMTLTNRIIEQGKIAFEKYKEIWPKLHGGKQKFSKDLK